MKQTGNVLRWFSGSLFFFISLSALLSGDVLAALAMAAVGMITIPPLSKLIQQKLRLRISKGLYVGIIILCLIITGLSSLDNGNIHPGTEDSQTGARSQEEYLQNDSEDKLDQDKEEHIASREEAEENNESKDDKESGKSSGKTGSNGGTKPVLSELRVHFIDVGQADSILIEDGSHAMLIDAGNNADSELVVEYIRKQGIEKLSYVIGTHPHEDHIGGLDAVIRNFHIEKVMMPNAEHTSKTYEDVLLAIQEKGLKISLPVPGSEFKLGDGTVKVLAPNGEDNRNLNNASIVLKLQYGDSSFLFTGDAEKESEEEMIAKGFDLKADVLKIGHHGSSTSTSTEFLDKVKPSYAVIMVGKGNDYNHPHKETMELLKERKIPVFRTDECGTIVAKSNGKTIEFNVQKGTYRYGDKEEGTAQGEEQRQGTSKKEEEIDTSTKENHSAVGNRIDIRIVDIDLQGELVTIKNYGNADVDLSDWRLLSVVGGQEFIFRKGFVLKAGETVTISSGDASGDLSWREGNIWNNKGDSGELYDDTGNLVSTYE